MNDFIRMVMFSNSIPFLITITAFGYNLILIMKKPKNITIQYITKRIKVNGILMVVLGYAAFSAVLQGLLIIAPVYILLAIGIYIENKTLRQSYALMHISLILKEELDNREKLEHS